ncbi:ORF6N domain-containing protein [Treponema primitia]|uniref:ORF6N domain-containing protein n=1 Tax=Treponema primitia TaxID=88058 RepID=UPI003981587F
MDEVIPIHTLIHEIRGCKVIIDSDLAALYQVETKVLNQAVKRNIGRFPLDFMFQLTEDEWQTLRSQIVTSKIDEKRGGRRVAPYAFTEHGILMLSSVLKSDTAIDVNIKIMRVFIQMRQYVLSQTGTNEQIMELRKLLLLYIENNDKRVEDILQALNRFIANPPVSKPIGFRVNRED